MHHFTRVTLSAGLVLAGTLYFIGHDAPVYSQAQTPLIAGSSGVAKGDFNGDGIGDLAIGEPGKDLSLTTFQLIDMGPPPRFQGTTRLVPDAGEVHVAFGTAASGLTSTGRDRVDQGISKDDNNHFGAAVAAGTFNADAFSDLAVGIPGVRVNGQRIGAIYVFNGSSSGLGVNASKVIFANQFSAAGTVIGAQATLSFPENMSMAVGDFNGDTFRDLAVEVAQAGSPNPRSAVLVISGSATGLDATRFKLLVVDDGLSPNNFPSPPPPEGQPAQCNRLVFCAESRGHISLAAGKLHSGTDILDDLVIGDPGCTEVDDQGDGVGAGGAEGCAIVIVGRTSGLSSFQWRVLKPGTADRRRKFGAALAIADFDGDTHNDLAIGAPDSANLSSSGSVRIFDGPSTGAIGSQSGDTVSTLITQDTIALDPSEAGDEFGAALAAGDFNGDGIGDLAIGIPGEAIGTISDAGAAVIISGSLNGLQAAPGLNHPGALLIHEDAPQMSSTAATGDRFGAALTAFDFGKPASGALVSPADLAVGVPFDDITFAANGTVNVANQGGAVHVLYGSATAGLTTSGSQFWTSPTPQTDAHFGASVY